MLANHQEAALNAVKKVTWREIALTRTKEEVLPVEIVTTAVKQVFIHPLLLFKVILPEIALNHRKNAEETDVLGPPHLQDRDQGLEVIEEVEEMIEIEIDRNLMVVSIVKRKVI